MALSRAVCVEIPDVVVKHETERALLVEIAGAEFWVPKSQIHDDSEVYKADTDGKLVVSEWLAKKNGFAAK